MSETSVMNAMDDALPSIGYLNVHGICRRTYGKETKAHGHKAVGGEAKPNPYC